jgi:hypothetical protein
MGIRDILSAGIQVSKDRGIIHMIRSASHSLTIFVLYKKIKRQNTFYFHGRKYNYFYNFLNKTWLNERCVEIPIVMDIVKTYRHRKILEIGNVLSNYVSFEHDIVDKYEIKDGVINQDVVDFKSTAKYDLIVSISTLEHVGWGDMKILRAIENMKSLVRPKGGLIVVTLPLGYNIAIDKLLKSGKMQFTTQWYLKRISKGNEWKESSWEDVQDMNYGKPFPNANGLLIGTIET